MAVTSAIRFGTVLVANRGEIARRVIRTLRRLGIRSVAVYSDADADAPHVREADAAVRIGPAPASSSYLDIPALVRAALDSGADAIHPGYGFLSENVAFARACAAAGIVFVGPGERALEVMGDKVRARAHVAASNVPIVPGFSADGLSHQAIADAAAAVGFPVLVKPSAGGGGKGMVAVHDVADLAAALESARRIATAAFGDDTLLIERLVTAPRHIEVQVLADAGGRVIHLGERECTLQRRHQKVIEESPSPVVDEALRTRLGAAACTAAASVDYRGAGTVEFLVSDERPDEFFFIEMNTRLQVEHPVTELVTGVDLVEQQLRIASGLPLPFAQSDVRLHGHAIEARVYAEAPARGFLPSTGRILAWRAAPAVRTDSGVETGTAVPGDYDPMLAKVIAFAPDRASALDRLARALGETVVLGVDTNLGFLGDLLDDPRVRRGELHTALIDGLPAFSPPEPTDGMLAAAARALRRDPSATHASPLWARGDGWRLGGAGAPRRVCFDAEDRVVDVPTDANASPTATVARDGSGAVWVHDARRIVRLVPVSRRERTLRALPTGVGARAAPTIVAPLPGTVVAVHVADGARVRAGDRIVTIEAMKMEHTLVAPADGVVRVNVDVSASVARNERLAVVTPDDRRPEEESHEK